MADNVIPFPAKTGEPVDAVVLCSIIVKKNGVISVDIGDEVETAAQYNWLMASVAAGLSVLVQKKETAING